MPGYRIDIDTSAGRANTDALRQSMDSLTDATKRSAEQQAQWNVRMAQQDVIKGVAGAVGVYQKAVEDLAKIQGVAEKEAKALGERAAQNASQMREAASGTTALTQSFGTLITQVTALAGAYVSLRSAASFLSDSTTSDARYDTLGVIMRTVGENAGYAASELNTYQASLERTGISMLASRQSISQMIQAQMDLSNSSKLARAAQDAAVIGNINSSEAFGRMTTAIQTAQPEMLRTMGIIVNFDEAYRKYARTISTTTDALTENQKMQARVAATMEATRAIAGSYEAAMDIARDELQTRQAYAGSFTDFLRGQVNIELGLYQGAQSQQLQEWQDYYNDLKKLAQGWMDTTKSGLVNLIDGAVTGKGEDAWKNMLANMRRQTLQFFVDIAMDWAKANGFKPAVGGALGIGGNETATKTVEGAARGLASQAVGAPSSESVLTWLGQGVPTYTPTQVAAPMQEAAKALGSIAGKYESGGNYGLVSRGDKWGDPGGVSYGKYQLSSVRGSLDEFLKASGYTEHPAINSDAFKSWWKDQAQTSTFQQAQEAFASEKFYKPVAEHLKAMG